VRGWLPFDTDRNMAEWLTLDELAAYLKRGRSTLYKMAREGGIPATKGWAHMEVRPGGHRHMAARANAFDAMAQKQETADKHEEGTMTLPMMHTYNAPLDVGLPFVFKGEFESKDVGSNTFASIADISEPPPWLPLRARIRRSERGRRSCYCSDSSSGY
jgi:hypothetical protein